MKRMSDTMKSPLDPASVFANYFQANAGKLPGSDNKAVAELRQKYMDDFVAKGLPTKKDEAWSFTSLKKIIHRFPQHINSVYLADTSDVNIDKLSEDLQGPTETDVVDIIFYNGCYVDKQETLPAGVSVEKCMDIIEDPTHKHFSDVFGACQDDALSSLSRAFLSHGVVVTIDEQVPHNTLIRVIYDGNKDDISIFINNLFIVTGKAKVSLIEMKTQQQSKDVHYYIQQRLRISSSAVLSRCRIVDMPQDQIFIVKDNLEIAQDAKLNDYCMSAGQSSARYEHCINLLGKDAHLNMGVAYILHDNAHHDMTFQIRHNNTQGTSRAMAKALLSDKASAVTQGKIYVAPGAQKTDSQEMFNAILLSDTSRYYTKPELEIYADDVVCGHGATISDFDEEAYFYLASRGIQKTAAKKILAKAFISECFDTINNDDLARIMEHYMTVFLETTLK